MFAKRFFQKALHQQHTPHGDTNKAEMDMQIAVHYGIPYAASILAYDPIQRLLAIGTLDGRIKIIGGDNIEALLISPKRLPYKYLEFIQNQGLLIAISNENEIQVWNLEFRQLFHSSQWEFNITAFTIIQGTYLMYLGDENGLLSVLKYDVDDGKLQKMPYNVPVHSFDETADVSSPDPQPIVGILPQPYTFGTRVLIAYEKGLLVLWDVLEDQAVAVGGSGDLCMKAEATDSQHSAGNDQLDSVTENEEEREICSLCWASKTGSVVAVGYITGDILLWDLSAKSSRHGKRGDISSNAVKLQLASGNRRLPVIVLHWSASSVADNDKGGNLFVYGGDDMGSEEVLTVLSLESPAGLETVRCISRMDLNLNGSFADMILIPDAGAPNKSRAAALFILTNPGQLNIYDGTLFSVQKPDERNAHPEAHKFPVAVPTVDPDMTVTCLYSLPTGKESSKTSLKKFYARRTLAPSLPGSTKWPLTGGVPSEMSLNEDCEVERIYVAGYQDGSVRMWDATFPVLALMFVLDGKVPGIDIDGANASVSSLAFCSQNLTLAIGNESGLVRIYRLHENTGGSSFHFVGESKKEVHIVHHGKGFHCNIAFMASNSPIRSLKYTPSGERLAVGYQSGQVAMFDANQLAFMFCMDCASGTNSPVISLSIHETPANSAPVETAQKESPKTAKCPTEVLICLTKDARVTILDSNSGLMINSQLLDQKQLSAVSMYVIDGASDGEHPEILEDKAREQGQPGNSENNAGERLAQEVAKHQKNDVHSRDTVSDPLLLICCEDTVLLFSLTSLMQESTKNLRKIKLTKQCSWSMAFKKIDEKACGLILIYQTGAIELRCLPDLQLISENSLMSILRWSFKTSMDKSMSSSNGHIALVNGSEFAIISLIASANDFRIPESLPCLHDKVLAAAAEAATSVSIDQKRKQDAGAGILGDIIKGFKGGKTNDRAKNKDSFLGQSANQQLEELFLRDPFAKLSAPNFDPIEELSIDDIEIDDVPTSSSMSVVNKKNKTDEEREKLFEGSSDAGKPRVRTTQEILTKYKFGGDAAAAAAYAKDKLMQRQEKLERISQRTAELQSGAENFADLAHELAKQMEKKKWWNI